MLKGPIQIMIIGVIVVGIHFVMEMQLIKVLILTVLREMVFGIAMKD